MSTEKYVNLITSEHKTKPMFMAWLDAILTKINAGACLADSFTVEFDTETAVGIQLDIIGEIVGCSRLLDFQPSTGNPVMTDDDYRFTLKAKIAKNQWDGTLDHIFKLWADLGLYIGLNIIDNQNMTMTVKLNGTISQFRQELITAGIIVPKPQTVGILYELESSKGEINVYCGVGSKQTFYYKTRMPIQSLGITGIYKFQY